MNADNVDNAHQLAARFRLSYDATQAILKPLKPVMTMPYGRGKLRLYDRTAAEQTIRKALEKTTPKPAAESPPGAQPGQGHRGGRRPRRQGHRARVAV